MLTPEQKKIYISIRAEQIKERQDRVNGHLFKSPYPLSKALEIATNQLNHDLAFGELRISLEDLLRLQDQECIEIVEQSSIDRAKVLLLIEDFNKLL